MNQKIDNILGNIEVILNRNQNIEKLLSNTRSECHDIIAIIQDYVKNQEQKINIVLKAPYEKSEFTRDEEIYNMCKQMPDKGRDEYFLSICHLTSNFLIRYMKLRKCLPIIPDINISISSQDLRDKHYIYNEMGKYSEIREFMMDNANVCGRFTIFLRDVHEFVIVRFRETQMIIQSNISGVQLATIITFDDGLDKLFKSDQELLIRLKLTTRAYIDHIGKIDLFQIIAFEGYIIPVN